MADAEHPRFTIEVTEADIEKAHRDSVAEAIARQIPDATRIYVDTETIRFTLGERELTYRLPPEAIAHVVGFDADWELAPVSFELREREVEESVR